jgi:hypothetical protein
MFTGLPCDPREAEFSDMEKLLTLAYDLLRNKNSTDVNKIETVQSIKPNEVYLKQGKTPTQYTLICPYRILMTDGGLQIECSSPAFEFSFDPKTRAVTDLKQKTFTDFSLWDDDTQNTIYHFSRNLWD